MTEDLTAVVDTNIMCPFYKKHQYMYMYMDCQNGAKKKTNKKLPNNMMSEIEYAEKLAWCSECHLSQRISKHINKYKVVALTSMGYHGYGYSLYEVKSLCPTSQDNENKYIY